MSRGINKVIIVGNLGNDPDTRMTPNGTCVCTLSIATDESYKDKQTGQTVPKTEWHRVVMFDKLAEICRDYLKKGSKVYVEGKLETRKWQDNTGADRYTTEIKANQMQMLDSREGGQNQAQQPQQQGYRQPSGQPMNPQQVQHQNHQAQPDTGFDNQVPF